MPIHKVVELVTSLQLDNETINSWKAGVARALKKYIPDGTLAEDALCEDCGSDDVVYQEGCLTCLTCGSSKMRLILYQTDLGIVRSFVV